VLREKIAAAEDQMKAALREIRTTFDHAGDKGASVEAVFREFLRRYLPRRFEVGHGEVIDTHGHRSRQTDVVIVNDEHPFTFTPELPGLFFVEGANAAGEVKSILTTEHLRQALTSAHQFKQLRIKPGAGTHAWASPADFKRFYNCPPFFLIAFESQLSISTVGEHIVQFQDEHSVAQNDMIDAIFILNTGAIYNLGESPGSFGMMSPDGTWLTGWQWTESDSVMFDFLGWLSSVMPRMLRASPILVEYLMQIYPSTEGNGSHSGGTMHSSELPEISLPLEAFEGPFSMVLMMRDKDGSTIKEEELARAWFKSQPVVPPGESKADYYVTMQPHRRQRIILPPNMDAIRWDWRRITPEEFFSCPPEVDQLTDWYKPEGK
jgi:hypothetical protein